MIDGIDAEANDALLQQAAHLLLAAGEPVKVIRSRVDHPDDASLLIDYVLNDSPGVTETSRLLLALSHLSQVLGAAARYQEQGYHCLIDGGQIGLVSELYYGYGLERDYTLANAYAEKIYQLLPADLSVVLDSPTGQAGKRAGRSFFESVRPKRDEQFFERMRAGYLWEARSRGAAVIHKDGNIENAVHQFIGKLRGIIGFDVTSKQKDTQPAAIGDVLVERRRELLGQVKQTDTESSSQVKSLIDSFRLQASTEHRVSILTGLGFGSKPDRWEPAGYTVPGGLAAEADSTYRLGMNELLKKHRRTTDALSAYLAQEEPIPEQSAAHRAENITSVLLPLGATISSHVNSGSVDLVADQGANVKLAEIASRFTSQTFSADSPAVRLVARSPLNELRFADTILYAVSDAGSRETTETAAGLSYDQQKQLIESYFENRSTQLDRASELSELATISYDFDFLTDLRTYWDIRSALDVRPRHQAFSPRYGYATPQEIEAAGLSEQFDSCFDLSFRLFGQLGGDGNTSAARDVLLLGHKIRWTCRLTLADLLSLRRAMDNGFLGFGPHTGKVVSAVLSAQSDAHPLLADIVFSD